MRFSSLVLILSSFFLFPSFFFLSFSSNCFIFSSLVNTFPEIFSLFFFKILLGCKGVLRCLDIVVYDLTGWETQSRSASVSEESSSGLLAHCDWSEGRIVRVEASLWAIKRNVSKPSFLRKRLGLNQRKLILIKHTPVQWINTGHFESNHYVSHCHGCVPGICKHFWKVITCNCFPWVTSHELVTLLSPCCFKWRRRTFPIWLK